MDLRNNKQFTLDDLKKYQNCQIVVNKEQIDKYEKIKIKLDLLAKKRNILLIIVSEKELNYDKIVSC